MASIRRASTCFCTFECAPGHNRKSEMDTVDPARVPRRTLYTGARMPAIGLGTFGSDHVSPDEIAAAVAGRRRSGLPPLRLRVGLRQRGPHRRRAASMVAACRARSCGSPPSCGTTSTAKRDVIPSCRQVAGRPAARLPGHVPGPLAVPEFPSAGLRRGIAQSRRPAVHPRELHEDVAADGEAGGSRPGAAHRHVAT